MIAFFCDSSETSVKKTKIAKTLGLISIRHQSDTEVLDWYQIDVTQRVFDIYDAIIQTNADLWSKNTKHEPQLNNNPKHIVMVVSANLNKANLRDLIAATGLVILL